MIVRDPAAIRGNRWVRTASPQPRQRAGFWMTVRMQHYWRFTTSGPNPTSAVAGTASSAFSPDPDAIERVAARFENPPGVNATLRPAPYAIPNTSNVCPLTPETFGTPGPAYRYWAGPIHNGFRSPSVSYVEPGPTQTPSGLNVPSFSMNGPLFFTIENHPTSGLPVTTGKAYWSLQRMAVITSGGAKYFTLAQVGTATLSLYFSTLFLPQRIPAANRAAWVAQVLARVSTVAARFRIGAPVTVDFSAISGTTWVYDLLEWDGSLRTTYAAGSPEAAGRGLTAEFRPTSFTNYGGLTVPTLGADLIRVQVHENLAL